MQVAVSMLTPRRREHATLPTKSLLIRPQDFFRFDAGDRAEFTVGNCLAECGHAAEVIIGGSAAEELLLKVLARNVGGLLHDGVVAPGTVHARGEDRDHVLAALREFGHTALSVGQFELELTHRAGDFERHSLQPFTSKLGMFA